MRGGNLSAVRHLDVNTSYYFWEHIGAFLVRDGRNILVSPRQDVEESQLRLSLLGPIIATILLQREYLVLHASAVTFKDNGSAIFVGEKGEGKSSLAAALHAHGHGFLSYDVVAPETTEISTLPPPVPRPKLWPEAIHLLEKNPEDYPRIINDVDKRNYRVSQRFYNRPEPLHCIYLLSEGERPEVVSLSPTDAFLGLMAHTFAARLGRMSDEQSRAMHFKQLTTLVREVPVYRLKRIQSQTPYNTITRLVEEHFYRNGHHHV